MLKQTPAILFDTEFSKLTDFLHFSSHFLPSSLTYLSSRIHFHQTTLEGFHFKGFQQARQQIAVHLKSIEVSISICMAQPRITQDGRKLIGMMGHHWRKIEKDEYSWPGSSAIPSVGDLEQSSDYQRCVLTSHQRNMGCLLQPKPQRHFPILFPSHQSAPRSTCSELTHPKDLFPRDTGKGIFCRPALTANTHSSVLSTKITDPYTGMG